MYSRVTEKARVAAETYAELGNTLPTLYINTAVLQRQSGMLTYTWAFHCLFGKRVVWIFMHFDLECSRIVKIME